MPNFIVCRFTDNDFHEPLRQAVEFVVETNKMADLALMSDEKISELVSSGMFAYDILRKVRYDRVTDEDNLSYLRDTLKVYKSNKLPDPYDGLEGYVIDLHNASTSYFGY